LTYEIALGGLFLALFFFASNIIPPLYLVPKIPITLQILSITSNDPTVLTQQEKRIQSQISQLPRQSGNSHQIQKLNQALQSIQKRPQLQFKTAV
jgi:hypothetical protein